MDPSPGKRVQALDQLGRWEGARVLAVTEEGIKVSFDGYTSAYDLMVSTTEVRDVIDPFHHLCDSEYRKYFCFVAHLSISLSMMMSHINIFVTCMFLF